MDTSEIWGRRCPNTAFTLEELRSRILARYASPYDGRYDTSFDIEAEFGDLVSSYKFLLREISKITANILDQMFIIGLQDELEDITSEIYTKWRNQDAAIEHSKYAVASRASCVHPPNQTTFTISG